MSANAGLAFWAGGGLVAGLFLIFAIRAGRRLRFLIDTPTSKAKAVFIGQVEVAGRATSERPARTFLAETDAVWYRYDIAEEWERWEAWSLIDVQLKRRADLIPRLVEVVTGLRDHERRVQTEVAALRAQAGATPAWEPGTDVAGTGATIRAVAERYPELKTNDAFLRLQRELSDTETRIALARDYYNEIATHANTRREIIPDAWIAPLAGLKDRPLLEAASFERAAVQVKLDA